MCEIFCVFVFFLGRVVASPFLPVGLPGWDDSWQRKFSSFVSFGSGILKVSSGRE